MTLEFDDQTSEESKDSHLLYAKFQKSSQVPFIISFLIKRHIVKNEDSARKLLLALSIVILAISIYLIINSFNGPVFINTIRR
jgi:hypothetical protein